MMAKPLMYAYHHLHLTNRKMLNIHMYVNKELFLYTVNFIWYNIYQITVKIMLYHNLKNHIHVK